MIYVIIVIGILILYVIYTYNVLVKLRNKVKDSWSQVDIKLKMRFDLIPNIVETVKGYMKHENETLEAVIEARSKGTSAKTKEEEIDADNMLTSSLTKLFALAEAYPELKANESFKKLHENLTDIENKISFARSFYNDSVLEYKNKIESFPTLLFAGLLGFKEEKFFEINEEEKENVKVDFDN